MGILGTPSGVTGHWKILMGNRVKNATYTVVGGAENASYPFNNALDEDRYTITKTNTTTDTVYRIDLATAYTIEGWAMGFHTIGTCGASVILRYSETDNAAEAWATLTTAGTFAAATVGDNNCAEAFVAVSKRYWWVAVANQTAVAQIGEIALFDVVRQLDRSPVLPVGRDRILNVATGMSKGGQVQRSKQGVSKKAWVLTLQNMTRTTDYEYLFNELIETYTENYRPFWFTDEYYSSSDLYPAYMVYVNEDKRVSSARTRRDLYEMMGIELVEC